MGILDEEGLRREEKPEGGGTVNWIARVYQRSED